MDTKQKNSWRKYSRKISNMRSIHKIIKMYTYLHIFFHRLQVEFPQPLPVILQWHKYIIRIAIIMPHPSPPWILFKVVTKKKLEFLRLLSGLIPPHLSSLFIRNMPVKYCYAIIKDTNMDFYSVGYMKYVVN